MKEKSSSVNVFLLLIVAASVLLNLFLFRKIGEKSLEFKRPASVPIVEVDHVRKIAVALGMRPTAGKTEGDIATDVKLAIEDAPVAPKRILSDVDCDMVAKLLDAKEKKAFMDMQSFFKTIAGKRYLIISEE